MFPCFGMVGIGTYALFDKAWLGRTEQVTLEVMSIFQTNSMMVFWAWRTQNKQNNDAKDHSLFYLKNYFTTKQSFSADWLRSARNSCLPNSKQSCLPCPPQVSDDDVVMLEVFCMMFLISPGCCLASTNGVAPFRLVVNLLSLLAGSKYSVWCCRLRY
jgi:hypothetical protein